MRMSSDSTQFRLSFRSEGRLYLLDDIAPASRRQCSFQIRDGRPRMHAAPPSECLPGGYFVVRTIVRFDYFVDIQVYICLSSPREKRQLPVDLWPVGSNVFGYQQADAVENICSKMRKLSFSQFMCSSPYS